MTEEEQKKVDELMQDAMLVSPPAITSGYGLVAPPIPQIVTDLPMPINPNANS